MQRPALQEGEDGTNLFEEQNESFISGDFYDELGEDFFGFRELGLDKEFDMISLSVVPVLKKRVMARSPFAFFKAECAPQSIPSAVKAAPQSK